MTISALLLRQLYTSGSLENDAEGFQFSLKNRFSDALLTRIYQVRVDDNEVPLEHLLLDLGDGHTMAATDVSPQAPAPFALQQVARVMARVGPLPNGSHEIRCDVETDSFGRLEIVANDAIATAQPPRPTIPWDPDERTNFGAEMVARRQHFVEEYAGVKLHHVAGHSFDPAVAKGNIENFTGVAQIPIGFAGPLRINGEHAEGEFLIPLATTEGTLVASYNRGMKVLNLSGGVTCTVVGRLHAAGAGLRVRLGARGAGLPRLGAGAPGRDSPRRPRPRRAWRKLHDIDTYLANKFAFLRFNYTTGDAAGQNMVGRATFAACSWILEQLSGRPAVLPRVELRHRQEGLAGQRDAHPRQAGHRRGDRPARRPDGAPAGRAGVARATTGAWPTSARSCRAPTTTALHSPNGITAMFIATGQDVANVAESFGGHRLHRADRRTATCTSRSRSRR